MTPDRDDTGEDTLAEIDLHVWRVPPPAPIHRPSLLVRALSRAAASPKRSRIGWALAAIVLVNALITTLIVILVARAPAKQDTVIVQATGGGPVDAEVRDVLQRLEQEQRELERKLSEIRELRALVVELSEKVRQYEEQDRARTVPKQRKAAERNDRAPVDPY